MYSCRSRKRGERAPHVLTGGADVTSLGSHDCPRRGHEHERLLECWSTPRLTQALGEIRARRKRGGQIVQPFGIALLNELLRGQRDETAIRNRVDDREGGCAFADTIRCCQERVQTGRKIDREDGTTSALVVWSAHQRHPAAAVRRSRTRCPTLSPGSGTR